MKVGIEVQGLKPLLRDLNRLGKETNRRIRAEVKEVAADEVPRLQAAAKRSDKQSAAIAVSIRARADRVPMIVAGGAKRLPIGITGKGKKRKKGPKAGDIFFGAEYGGRKRPTTQQFRPHRGKQGYFMWPQIRKDEDRMVAQWTKVLDDILSEIGD